MAQPFGCWACVWAIPLPDWTGWREDGINGYLWGLSTDKLRCFHFDRSRARAVAKRLLGFCFGGVLVCDFYGGYNFYDGPIQRCAVHRIRSILERVPKAYRESVKKSLHEIFHAEDEAAARRMADEFVDKRRNPVRLDHQVSVGPA